MPDTTGQQDIRGIDVQKLVVAIEDEALVLKKYARISTTSAREIRWVKKTAGFLTSPTTSGITTDMIQTDQLALPVTVRPSFTRMTSYVKKFFLTSDTISTEDEKDCMIDSLGIIIEDVVKGVANQVDRHIYDILTEATTSGTPNPTTVPTSISAGTGWTDVTNGNPVLDLLSCKASIRSYRYEAEGAIVYFDEIAEKNLLNWIISIKGSSIPAYSSSKVEDGKILSLLGLKVVSNHNATTDWLVVFVPNKAVAYKEFMPITSAVVENKLIGKTVRVAEEGVALLEHPYACAIISGIN